MRPRAAANYQRLSGKGINKDIENETKSMPTSMTNRRRIYTLNSDAKMIDKGPKGEPKGEPVLSKSFEYACRKQ